MGRRPRRARSRTVSPRAGRCPRRARSRTVSPGVGRCLGRSRCRLHCPGRSRARFRRLSPHTRHQNPGCSTVPDRGLGRRPGLGPRLDRRPRRCPGRVGRPPDRTRDRPSDVDAEVVGDIREQCGNAILGGSCLGSLLHVGETYGRRSTGRCGRPGHLIAMSAQRFDGCWRASSDRPSAAIVTASLSRSCEEPAPTPTCSRARSRP